MPIGFRGAVINDGKDRILETIKGEGKVVRLLAASTVTVSGLLQSAEHIRTRRPLACEISATASVTDSVYQKVNGKMSLIGFNSLLFHMVSKCNGVLNA